MLADALDKAEKRSQALSNYVAELKEKLAQERAERLQDAQDFAEKVEGGKDNKFCIIALRTVCVSCTRTHIFPCT